MRKKILKIIGIVLLLLVITLIAAPFFLKGKIADIIKNKVNANINATFDFEEANLSLFSNFPNAEVTLEGISLINHAPFEGDTLFTSEKIVLKMSANELFKSADEPILIKSLKVNDANLHLALNKEGVSNYDIGKTTEEKGSVSSVDTEDGFSLALESYEITNTAIRYDDLTSGIHLELVEMNHSGTGDLSLETSELDTKTSALVSFEMDSTTYLSNNKIALDALIGIDLNENKYSLLENTAIVNKLPLVFDGFVKLNEENQEVAIHFKTPSTAFTNFLALIPESYASTIENVQTTGNFEVEGRFQGVVDDTHIPSFNIKINSNNASFKYPDLPKTVRDVNIDTEITNTSGIAEDTFIDINKLSFKIDDDRFYMQSQIRELLGNTKVSAQIDALLHLANISKAYPMPADVDLKGLLQANMKTTFDMESVEQKKYENTKTSGTFSITDFEYNSEELANAIAIEKTAFTFNPETVKVNEFKGKTGETDFEASGTMDNFLGFLFNDEKVKGNFDLKSDRFVVNDFMVEESPSEEKSNSSEISKDGEEKIKIPSFLDCSIKAKANTVIYDNLTLKNVSGNLRIKDETAELSQMKSSLFDGNLAFNGKVSTKSDTPSFAMQLGMENFKIGETFKAMELFQVLAPIANALKGKLDSDIQISGNLNDDFTPNMASISGKVLAELLATDIDPEKTKLLSSLTSKLDFLKSDKLNLKGLKTALSFEDGMVKVKPFTIAYEDIDIHISGGHSFDQKLNYTASLEVPAKYLGKEVNSLIVKIDDEAVENLTIPVKASIGGGYASPEVTTDFSSGVKNLTAQLVEVQKQKLLNRGKNIVGDLLGGNTKNSDSTNAKANDNLNNVLDILGKGNKKQDSSAVKKDSLDTGKDAIKEKASDIIGGLFGKKKKKDTTGTKKDSVQ